MIQYQILQTNITRTTWQTVRRITDEILGVKRLSKTTLLLRNPKAQWLSKTVVWVRPHVNNRPRWGLIWWTLVVQEISKALVVDQYKVLYCTLFCFSLDQNWKQLVSERDLFYFYFFYSIFLLTSKSSQSLIRNPHSEQVSSKRETSAVRSTQLGVPYAVTWVMRVRDF